MKRPVCFVVLALSVVALSVVGCSRKPAAATSASTSGTGQAAPAAMPAAGTPQAAPGAVETVTGEVAETMDASTYTYLRVKTLKGDVWAATAKTPVKVGDQVTLPLESLMRDFHSPSLNRDFPAIYFVSRVAKAGDPDGGQPAQAGAVPPPMAVGHGATGATGHGTGAASTSQQAPAAVKPMPPPPGGSSVADVWARRAALAGKTVTINGTVVKFNGGILGRNWIHVQDGSGKASDGTNDILVTTGPEAAPKVGDTVTVTGKVAIDQDFGSGYAYKTMIEGAKIR